MLTKGFLKPEISVGKLGRRRFWTGNIIGLLIAVVLSYFFSYSRESLRSITLMADLFMLTEGEFRLYDLFFAAFAASLGLGFTVIYWLRGNSRNIKKNHLRLFTISNAWFINLIALMLISRFGTTLTLSLYGLRGYDGQLDLLQGFWILLFLIPVYIFFAHWNSVKLIFRTSNWVPASILIYSLTAFGLFKITPVNREILNQAYYSQNKDRFDYIDSEFEKARNLGVFFSDTTRQILKRKYAERTISLVYDLKQAFETDRKVPLDTLILQKIVTHNMNRHILYFYRNPQDRDKNWPYAYPEYIYNQILKHDIDSKETNVLFEILAEQIFIFTAPEVDWTNWETFTRFERERSIYRNLLTHSTGTIQSRLIHVIDKLKSDDKYERYSYLLPDTV